MKKFLTVLLALSVVFTYTVGTAFAVTGTEAPSKSEIVRQAEAKATEQFKRVEAAAIDWVGNPGQYAVSNIPVDVELSLKHVQIPATNGSWFNPDGVKKLSAVVIDNAQKELNQKVTEIVAGTYATQDELTAALDGLKTIADTYTGAGAFDGKVKAIESADLAKYSLEYAKETYLKYVESIDELKYSATPDKDGVINRDKVNKLKSDAKADIEGAVDAYGIDNESVRDIADDFYAAVKAIPTSSEEEDAFKNLAEAKEYYSTKVESELAARKADVKYALNQALKQAQKNKAAATAEKIEAAIARADADFAAAVQCAKAEIGAQKTIDTVRNMYNSWSAAIPALGYDATNYQPTGYLPIYIVRAEKAAELEALANKMKAETGFNGAPVYVAIEVDEALADDLEAVYTGGTASALQKLVPAEDLVKSEMNRVIVGTDGKVTIDKIKYDAVNSWLTANSYTNVDKVDEVKAVVDEAKAAIRAAKTVEDVDAAFKAAYEKYDAIVTDADMSKYQRSAASQAAVTKYEAKLSAALIAKKADYGTAKFAQDFEAMNGLINNLKKDYLQKAYDAADMEAKYNEAVKVIDELKTKAALKAEADAINAEILEVSKLTLTAADEERVLAIADREEAFTEYKKLIDVTGYTTYGTDSYKAQMKALVKKELQKAYDAIGAVTVDDEAAINDLIAKADAFEDNYNEAFDNAKMAKLASDLVNAKIDAVEKAIGVIDASAEKVDVAAIKAAREAYDALGEYGVDVSRTMFHKLLSLENLVEEYTVKAVEALKITASSKAGKGYIQVKWTVKGDAETADGYQVCRSTKRNSGFGTKPYFTTKNKTYKNTKSLKKGTRYYYKVRAYVEIDGQKYYSDWSNKAYRIAK